MAINLIAWAASDTNGTVSVLQGYLPIANFFALMFVAIYQAIAKLRLEEVHKLVNSTADNQQKKIDSLETELKTVQSILNKIQSTPVVVTMPPEVKLP